MSTLAAKMVHSALFLANEQMQKLQTPKLRFLKEKKNHAFSLCLLRVLCQDMYEKGNEGVSVQHNETYGNEKLLKSIGRLLALLHM